MAAPSFRAGSTASAASATTCSVKVPATAVAGDRAFITVNSSVSVMSTFPTGWTPFAATCDGTPSTYSTSWPAGAQNPAGSPTANLWVFTKVLTSGDIGANVTVGFGSNATIAMACGVYFHASGTPQIGVGPVEGPQAANPGQDGGTSPRLPPIVGGANDLIVAFGGDYPYLSTSNQGAVTSVPAGWTVREQGFNQNGALSKPQQTWIADGPTGNLVYYGLKPDDTNGGLVVEQDFNASVVVALSPPSSVQRATDALPAALSGVPLHAYGNSLFAWVPATTAPPYTFYSVASVPDRIAWAMQASSYSNFALCGALSSDLAGFAFGNPSYYTRSPSNMTGWTVQRAGTWLSQSNRTGLVLVDTLGNDMLHDGDASPSTSTKSKAGALNGTDALVRLLRAASMTGPTDASITKVGTWTTVAKNDVGNGSYVWSSTPGDYIQITATATDLDVILLALDDANFGQTGAAFSVTVDGVPWSSAKLATGSATTSNQMKKSPGNGGGLSGAYNQSPYCVAAVPVHGMGSGSHTIRITHAGSAGQYLCFNAYLTPAATPPTILLNKLAHYNWAQINTTLGSSLTDATADAYSALIDTIAGSFKDGKVLVFDPLHSGGWDYTTMVNAQDYVHPFDKGTGFVTHGMLHILNGYVSGDPVLTASVSLTASGGLQRGGVSNLSAAASLTATGTTVKAGTAAMSASVSLGAQAAVTHRSAASLGGVVSVGSVAKVTHVGVSALSAGASLSAAGNVNHGARATLSSALSTAAVANVVHVGSANLNGTVDLIAAVSGTIRTGAANLSAGLVLSPSGARLLSGQSDLVAVTAMAATGGALRTGGASLNALLALVAAGEKQIEGAVALSAALGLVATGKTVTMPHGALFTLSDEALLGLVLADSVEVEFDLSDMAY